LARSAWTGPFAGKLAFVAAGHERSCSLFHFQLLVRPNSFATFSRD
jgi:hypothetical protein